MLVLSRHRDEAIIIGDEVEVKILTIGHDHVRIGIDAPKEIRVDRKEIRTLQLRNGVKHQQTCSNFGTSYRVTHRLKQQNYLQREQRYCFSVRSLNKKEMLQKSTSELVDGDQSILRGLPPEDAFAIGMAYAEEKFRRDNQRLDIASETVYHLAANPVECALEHAE